MKLTGAALLVAATALSACGTVTTASPTPTAAQVITQLAHKVPTATASTVYDATTDPNHELGRPGGYTSKAAFADSRIDPSDPKVLNRPGSVDLGGSVEVYPDEQGARNRVDYMQAISKGAPFLAEYDYRNGRVVLRVSRALTPDQAGEYQVALGS